MNIFKNISYILLISVTLGACSKSNTPATTPPIITPPPTVVTPLISLPQGWYYSSTFTGSIPSGMQVYIFDTIFAGRKTKAFCIAYDSKLNKFEFKPVMSSTAKTPSTFYAEKAGITYACINAGYFGSPNQSFSLVKYNNTVSSANIKALSRPLGTYYPTRAAFGVDNVGAPSTAWIYNVGAGNDLIYSYPAPSPNNVNVAPLAVPTASFPAGGTIWNTTSAIGGSPMLLKNSAVNISDNEELISINNTTSRPRSAIGHNTNGIVIMIAVEGDNTAAGYAGLNLLELANMMQSLSCTNAINLDGGGSTSMVIGGRLTVRPGDAGVERPVISAVVLKLK